MFTSCSYTGLLVRRVLPKTAVFHGFSCLNCCQVSLVWLGRVEHPYFFSRKECSCSILSLYLHLNNDVRMMKEGRN